MFNYLYHKVSSLLRSDSHQVANQVPPPLIDLVDGPGGGGGGGEGNRKRKFEDLHVETKKRRRLAMENSDDEEDVQILHDHNSSISQKILSLWTTFWSPKPKSKHQPLASTSSALNAASSCSAGPATSKDDLNTKDVEFVKEVNLSGTYQAAPPTKLQTVQPEAEVQLIKVENPNKVECIDLTKPGHDDHDTPGSSTARSSSGSSVILDTVEDTDVKYLGRFDTHRPSQRFKVFTEKERKLQRKNNIPANLKTSMKSNKRWMLDGIFNNMNSKERYNTILKEYNLGLRQKQSSFPRMRSYPYNMMIMREAESFVKKNQADEVDNDISIIEPSKPSAGSLGLSVPRYSLLTPAFKLTSPTTGSKIIPITLTGAKSPTPLTITSPSLTTSTPFVSKPVKKDDEVVVLSRSSSLEDEFRSQEVYSKDYLKKLEEKYGSRSRERQKKINKETLTTEFQQKERKEKLEENINERILKHLKITSAVMEEPEYQQEEDDTTLPDITSDMDQVIRRAYSARESELLIEEYKIPISGKDVDTLKGLNWLNDEIINFYLQMIVARGGSTEKYPKVHAYNTFFYTTYRDNGYSRVRRWTKKVDIFAHDLLLVPVHLGMHWCLATIDVANKTINYYDSMGGNNQACLDHLTNYIKEEHLDKKKEALDMSGWKQIIRKDIPQQQNGSDCGMFTCKFAEYLSRRANITFTQQDMPYFRRRMVYEIVKNDLMKP